MHLFTDTINLKKLIENRASYQFETLEVILEQIKHLVILKVYDIIENYNIKIRALFISFSSSGDDFKKLSCAYFAYSRLEKLLD